MLISGSFYIPQHDRADILVSRWLSVCPSLSQSSVVRPSIFSFPDDNLSKYQSIFTKHVMCIDIVALWYNTANLQIASMFDRVICPPHESGRVLLFHILIFTISTALAITV